MCDFAPKEDFGDQSFSAAQVLGIGLLGLVSVTLCAFVAVGLKHYPQWTLIILILVLTSFISLIPVVICCSTFSALLSLDQDSQSLQKHFLANLGFDGNSGFDKIINAKTQGSHCQFAFQPICFLAFLLSNFIIIIHDMHIDVTDPEWVANGSIMADASCETLGAPFFLHRDHILGV